MSRILAGVLAGCMVLAVAGVAGAGIPDPDLSEMRLSNLNGYTGLGLMTCPAGDANPFEFLEITAKESNGNPIEGIPYSSIYFETTGGECTFEVARRGGETPAHGETTNANGQISFTVTADFRYHYPTPIYVDATIYTVDLSDNPDTLTCNSVDYVDSTPPAPEQVDPVDFSNFAGDFNTVAQRSDFDWDGGVVDPVDFSRFAAHFGHFGTAP